MGFSLLEMQKMFSAEDLSVEKAKLWIRHSSFASDAHSLARNMTGYSSMLKPAIFKCREHGEFSATPSWVSKRGCPACAARTYREMGVDPKGQRGGSDEDSNWLRSIQGDSDERK